MAAPSSKVRRVSVLEDLDSRLDALRSAAEQVDKRELDRLTNKATIVEFLNVSRIAMNMHSKTETMRVRFGKIRGGRQEGNFSVFKIDRATLLLQDDYIRTVGVFSNALGTDELVSRALKVPPRISEDTVSLVRAAAAYANAFYKPKPTRDQVDDYTDALVSFESNIILLGRLDYVCLRESLQQLTKEDLNQVLAAMEQTLPNVEVSASKNRLNKVFQPRDDGGRVVALVRKYVELISELHGNRSLQSLPSSTVLYPILNKSTRKELSDVGQYVQEADRVEKSRMVIDMMLALCSALVRSLAVLAAFRTTLFANELQNEKLNHWCLLDLPDRKDLDKYITSLM